MKKIIFIILSALFSVLSLHSLEVTRGLYTVTGEISQDKAGKIADVLNLYHNEFNDIFRFNPDGPGYKYQVLVFPDKGSYDEYLNRTINQTREDFVFLKYSKPEKSQLVLFDCGEGTWNKSLARQCFFQYIYGNIQNPPLWLREGFGIYFESLLYDSKTNNLKYIQPLAWLDTVKSQRNKGDKISASDIISALPDQFSSSILYPQSWALVYYMMNTGDSSVSRLLWDSLFQLSVKGSIESNTQAVANSILQWITPGELNAGFEGWIAETKTWTELLNSGIKYYTEKEYQMAEKTFEEAVLRNERDSTAYYYLGLIAYNNGDYITAETYYRTALQLGADAGTVNWALGLTAYANSKHGDAIKYLNEAMRISPEKYKERCTELINKINNPD